MYAIHLSSLYVYRTIPGPATFSMEMTSIAVANPLTYNVQKTAQIKAERSPEYVNIKPLPAQEPSVDVSHNIVTEENLAYATHVHRHNPQVPLDPTREPSTTPAQEYETRAVEDQEYETVTTPSQRASEDQEYETV